MLLEGIVVCQHILFYKFSMLTIQFDKSKCFYKWLCWCFCFLQEYVPYDQDMVRKLGKLDFKLRKAKPDIKFLCTCDNNDIIPNFLCFQTANKNTIIMQII